VGPVARMYVTVTASGMPGGSGERGRAGVARWDDIPIRAAYNASQDDGYLGAGGRADDAARWVWCACVCGVACGRG
jgi:hypothetical protein